MNKFTLLLLLFCFQINLSGQSSLKLFLKPAEYDNPKGDIAACHACVKKGYPLIVMSDRDNNETYESPSNPTVKNKIKFKEFFYVTGEEGEYLRLAKYEGASTNKDKILNPQDYGWIKKDKLLLWDVAISNQQGFMKKALALIRDGNVFVKPQEYINADGNLIFYNQPVKNNNAKLDNIKIKIFQFLYVLKEDNLNKTVLIGTQEKVTPNVPGRVLGWVPREMIYIWETRLCIQPNFSPEAMTERRNTGSFSKIFITDQAAAKYKDGNEPGPNEYVIIDDLDKESKVVRWPSNKLRMPIIFDNKSTKIYESGYSTDIVSSTGEKSVSLKPEQIDKLNRLKINARNLNIVFVIDGSNAMIPKTEITNAMTKVYSSMNQSLKELFTLRFGVSIYGNSEKDVSTLPITSTYDDALNFIMRNKITSENSKYKSLKKGMLEGLKLFTGNNRESQSNYIIVIGGAGDAKDQLDKEIINLYAKANVNAMAFQYNCGLGDEFQVFTSQIKDIMDKSNSEMLETIRERALDAQDLNKIKPYKWDKPDMSKVNYFSFKIEENANFMAFAEITFPKTGSNLDNTSFAADMDELLFRATDKTGTVINDIDLLLTVDSKIELTNAMRLFLGNMGNNVDEQAIMQTFKSTNFQFFGSCYFPREKKGLNANLHERVLFFTRSELFKLVQTLTELSNVPMNNNDQLREKLYAAILKVIGDYFGEKESKEAIKTLNGKQLINLIAGQDPISPIFNDKSFDNLSNILDKKAMKDEQVRKIAQIFNEKVDLLNRALSDDNFRWQEDVDLTYYWIPEKYMP